MNLLLLDELNKFKDYYISLNGGNGEIHTITKDGYGIDPQEIEDSVLDLLIMAYLFGRDDANSDLNENIPLNAKSLEKALNKQYKGKGWRERVEEYVKDGKTLNKVFAVAESESERMIGAGGFDTATEAGARYKTWRCMKLPTSRDTHIFLDGEKRKINERFVTFAGNMALYPGDFDVPEENVNCLCSLKYSK